MNDFTEIEQLPDEIHSIFEQSSDMYPDERISFLRPYSGKYFWIDTMLGQAYDQIEDYDSAYSSYKSALSIAYNNRNLLPPPALIKITNFFFELYNEAPTMSQIADYYGTNDIALILMAYMYLSNNANHRKLRALTLVKYVHEKLFQFKHEGALSNDSHTIACVALWNKDYKLAEQVLEYFLSDEKFCRNQHGQIESFIYMVAAIPNIQFQQHFVDAYPQIYLQYQDILDAGYCINHPQEKMKRSHLASCIEKLIQARSLYELE